MRPRAAALAVVLLVGSCVGGRETTGPDYAELDLMLRPALIPSPADGTALPIHRIRTVVARQPDGAVLSEQRFDVSPNDASWTLEVRVPVGQNATEVVVHLLLLHVGSDGAELVQFSGRTAPLTLSAGSTVEQVDADIVRGPPGNLAVTGISIVSAPDTLNVGDSAELSATILSSGESVPQVFWTSLDPDVVGVVDSVATGLAPGSARVVASAGAHADTADVVVIVPPVDSVRVSPDSADVQVDQTRTYTVQLFDPSGGTLTGRPVDWITGNIQIAAVDALGVVTGVAPGITTVRATSAGVFDEAIVRVTAPPVGGGTNSWTGTSGNWSDPAHWSLGRAPIADDTVRIEQSGDYTVTLDADATLTRLVLGGATDIVVLDVGDHTLTANGSTAGYEIEIGSLGSLQVGNGAVLGGDIRNAGLVRVAGAPSTIDASTFDNLGMLRLAAGSLVLGGAGGSEVLLAGTLDLGTNVIRFGANTTVTHDDGAILGTGIIVLESAELVLASNLDLDGPHLILEDGSSVEALADETLVVGTLSYVEMLSEDTFVEIEPDVIVQGSLSASGPNSRVGALVVAETGSVFIDDDGGGALLETWNVENFGDIWLFGPVATFGPGDFGQILNRSTGTIEINPGAEGIFIDGELINEGTINVGSPTHLRRTDVDANPVTAAHVNSGLMQLVAGGELRVQLGGAAPTFTNSGTITLNDASSVLRVENLADPAGAIINTDTGVLRGVGTVDVTQGIPIGVNHGTIEPGLSPGLLTWTGSIPMGPNGSIAIELQGTTPGTEHDRIDVSGDLELDEFGPTAGTLVVTAPSFVPNDGDRFAVLTFRDRFGDFTAVDMPDIGGITFETQWTDHPGIDPDTLYIVASGTAAPVGANRWQEPVSDNWSVGANWSLGRAPIAGDTVYIDQGSGYTVTLDVDATIDALVVQGVGAPATLDLGDAQLVVNGSGPGVEVYVQALGRITINNGALRTVDAQNDGLVRATGALAIFEFTTLDNGGSIEVASGGVLSVGNSSGSEQLQSGTLRLEGGGIVSVITGTDLRYYGGSIEGIGNLIFAAGSRLILMTDLAFDGPAIQLVGASIEVNGNETLAVGTGGTLSLVSDNAPVVVNASVLLDGFFIASGPDNRVGALDVGPAASVFLAGASSGVTLVTGDVVNQGEVVATGAGASFGPGNDGTIVNEVTGIISFTAGAVGNDLNGVLQNHGLIQVGSHTRLRNLDALDQDLTAHHVNSGVIDIFDGGTLQVQLGGSAPSFTNVGTISLVAASSVLEVLDDASPAATVVNGEGSALEGHGTVVLSPTVSLTQQGLLSPGSSPGTLSFAGDISMEPTGQLIIELDGTIPGTGYDQLLSTGDIVFDAGGGNDGTLEITLPGAFVPSAGDTFAIMTFQSRSGTFDTVSFPVIDGIDLDTLWTQTEGMDTLYIVATAAGGPAPVNRWTNSVSGNWSDGANWSAQVAPAATDSVVIDVAGSYTVTLDVNTTVRNLTIAGGALVEGTGRTISLTGAGEIRSDGLLALTTGTVNGSGSLVNSGGVNLIGGSWGIPLQNDGILLIDGAVTVSGDITTGATSMIRAEAVTPAASLTVTNGFTNNGTIELTGANFAHLTVSNGTLVNNVDALIHVLDGGGRNITAALDNRGTLQLDRPLEIDAANATHTNSGTIDLTSATLTVTQSDGTGSFTNEGTGLILLGFNLNVNGGTLALTGGTVTGPDPSRITFSDGTLDYVFASLSERLTLNNVTVTNGLTIPVGGTLTLWGGGAVPTDIPTSAVDVQGTLQIVGVVSLGGALSTSGTLDVHGTSGIEAQLTVADGWTNTGTVQLTGGGVPPNDVGSTLTVTNGTLVNADLAVITSIPGPGVTRALNADVDNQGIFNANQSMTMTGALDQRNALTVPADQTFALDGVIRVYLGHSTFVDVGGALTATSGCVDQGGGQITGGGTYPTCFVP